jgi:hypothetical protein
MYDPNEPHDSDHNAPYNEIDIVNEDGEEETVCGCTSCMKALRRKWLDDNY